MKYIFDCSHIKTHDEAVAFLDKAIDKVLEMQNKVPTFSSPNGLTMFDTESPQWDLARKYYAAYEAARRYLKLLGIYWEERDGESILA